MTRRGVVILSETNDDVVRRIAGIVSNLKSSRENIVVAERELALAEGNYKMAKQKYAKGSGDAAEVKSALEGLTKANLINHQAKYDFQVAMIGLEEILKLDPNALQRE